MPSAAGSPSHTHHTRMTRTAPHRALGSAPRRSRIRRQCRARGWRARAARCTAATPSSSTRLGSAPRCSSSSTALRQTVTVDINPLAAQGAEGKGGPASSAHRGSSSRSATNSSLAASAMSQRCHGPRIQICAATSAHAQPRPSAPQPRLWERPGNAPVGPAVPGAADRDRVGPGPSDRRKWRGRRCAKVGSHSGIWKAEPGITTNSRGAWDKEQNLSLSLTKQTTGYPRLSPSCPGTQRHPPASVCKCWDLPPEEQRRAFSIQQSWLSLSLCEEGLHQGLEMAQRIKVLAAKLEDLSLIPTPGGRHWKENRLAFTCVPCCGPAQACMRAHTN